MHDVELVKVSPGGFVHLIADEVDSGLLLGVGKGRFDTTSDLRRPWLFKPPTNGFLPVFQPEIVQLIGHLPDGK